MCVSRDLLCGRIGHLREQSKNAISGFQKIHSDLLGLVEVSDAFKDGVGDLSSKVFYDVFK